MTAKIVTDLVKEVTVPKQHDVRNIGLVCLHQNETRRTSLSTAGPTPFFSTISSATPPGGRGTFQQRLKLGSEQRRGALG